MDAAGHGLLFISGLLLVACALAWAMEVATVRSVARRCVRTYRRCRQCKRVLVWDTERLVYHCACTPRGERIVRLTKGAWYDEGVRR